MFTLHSLRRSRSPLAPFIAGALVASVVGYASLGGTSGVVIPYSGHLDRDGAPLDALVTIEFNVFNGAADVTPCDTITVNNVLVSGGELATSIAGIDEACVRGKDVFLEVSVDADGNGVVPLNGRQRVFPSLAALTSGAGDFDVAGQLSATSITASDSTTATANVTGTLSLGIGACMRLGEADAEFLLCTSNGVQLRPVVDLADGDDIFRVTDADGTAYLLVEQNSRVLVQSPNGLEVENLSGTFPKSEVDPGAINARSSATVQTRMTSTGITSTTTSSTGTAINAPVDFSTGLRVRGGTAASRSAPVDPDTVSLIEENAADKLFDLDNDCIIDTLWTGLCHTNGASTQACICTCQNSDENGQGWYCFN